GTARGRPPPGALAPAPQRCRCRSRGAERGASRGVVAMSRPTQRGACPSLAAPMPTGDGLLVRLRPTGTIALAAFAAMCAAARRHGNGIVEVTARGSIQVRGLTADSAPALAETAAALGSGGQDGIPVLLDPLAGLDADVSPDVSTLAAQLRDASRSFAGELG